jgi:hypothetical protein
LFRSIRHPMIIAPIGAQRQALLTVRLHRLGVFPIIEKLPLRRVAMLRLSFSCHFTSSLFNRKGISFIINQPQGFNFLELTFRRHG